MAQTPEEAHEAVKAAHTALQQQNQAEIDAAHDQGIFCGHSYCGRQECADAYKAQNEEKE